MSVSGLAGSKFWGKNFFDTAEQGVIERAKAGNYEINRYEVPPDEVARWSKVAGEPIWNEWVKKMEGKGHKDAREILNSALECSRTRRGARHSGARAAGSRARSPVLAARRGMRGSAAPLARRRMTPASG